MASYMGRSLIETDPATYEDIMADARRQHDTIGLIASTNLQSRAVLTASGSTLANLYSEGYPGARYYQGQLYADNVERRAIERVQQLFGVKHANVQPYSGSPAVLEVYNALCKPMSRIVGMALKAGGHLTGGHKVSATGKVYDFRQYGVRPDGSIDMEEVARLVEDHKPEILCCGGTAIPRTIDFAAFAQIARAHKIRLVADISHIAGLVAGGVHPSPVGLADVTVFTTQKTLRGPRAAVIVTDDYDLAKAVNKSVFPGFQGGPHVQTIAALGVAMLEALQPEFREYAANVVANSQRLGLRLMEYGNKVITGGTDNHLLLIDVTGQGITGKPAAEALEQAGIVCNYNAVPHDPRKPDDPSGLRLGSATVTSRGMGPKHMDLIAAWFHRTLQGAASGDHSQFAVIAGEIRELCEQFPIYPWLWEK